MRFFSKKKNEELFYLLDEDDNEYTFGQDSSLRPEHALTPDEVLNFASNSEEGEIASTGALDSLKKRMLENTSDTKAEDNPRSAEEKSDCENNDGFDLNAFSKTYNKAKAEKQPKTDTVPHSFLTVISDEALTSPPVIVKLAPAE